MRQISVPVVVIWVVLLSPGANSQDYPDTVARVCDERISLERILDSAGAPLSEVQAQEIQHLNSAVADIVGDVLVVRQLFQHGRGKMVDFESAINARGGTAVREDEIQAALASVVVEYTTIGAEHVSILPVETILPETLAAVDGRTVTVEMLVAVARDDLDGYRFRKYDILEEYTREAIDDKLIDCAAGNASKTRAEFLAEKIEGRVTKPSKASVKSYLASPDGVAMSQGLSKKEAKRQAIERLKEQQRVQYHQELMDTLRASVNHELLIERPGA